MRSSKIVCVISFRFNSVINNAEKFQVDKKIEDADIDFKKEREQNIDRIFGSDTKEQPKLQKVQYIKHQFSVEEKATGITSLVLNRLSHNTRFSHNDCVLKG